MITDIGTFRLHALVKDMAEKSQKYTVESKLYSSIGPEKIDIELKANVKYKENIWFTVSVSTWHFPMKNSDFKILDRLRNARTIKRQNLRCRFLPYLIHYYEMPLFKPMPNAI